MNILFFLPSMELVLVPNCSLLKIVVNIIAIEILK